MAQVMPNDPAREHLHDYELSDQAGAVVAVFDSQGAAIEYIQAHFDRFRGTNVTIAVLHPAWCTCAEITMDVSDTNAARRN